MTSPRIPKLNRSGLFKAAAASIGSSPTDSPRSGSGSPVSHSSGRSTINESAPFFTFCANSSIETKDYLRVADHSIVTVFPSTNFKPHILLALCHGVKGKIPASLVEFDQHTSNGYLELLDIFLLQPRLFEAFHHKWCEADNEKKLIEILSARKIIYPLIIKLCELELADNIDENEIFRGETPVMRLVQSLFNVRGDAHDYRHRLIDFVCKKLPKDPNVQQCKDAMHKLLKSMNDDCQKMKIPAELVILLQACSQCLQLYYKNNDASSNALENQKKVLQHLSTIMFLRYICPALCLKSNGGLKLSVMLNKYANSILGDDSSKIGDLIEAILNLPRPILATPDINLENHAEIMTHDILEAYRYSGDTELQLFVAHWQVRNGTTREAIAAHIAHVKNFMDMPKDKKISSPTPRTNDGN